MALLCSSGLDQQRLLELAPRLDELLLPARARV
jgi:hypothetical protein